MGKSIQEWMGEEAFLCGFGFVSSLTIVLSCQGLLCEARRRKLPPSLLFFPFCNEATFFWSVSLFIPPPRYPSQSEGQLVWGNLGLLKEREKRGEILFYSSLDFRKGEFCPGARGRKKGSLSSSISSLVISLLLSHAL